MEMNQVKTKTKKKKQGLYLKTHFGMQIMEDMFY